MQQFDLGARDVVVFFKRLPYPRVESRYLPTHHVVLGVLTDVRQHYIETGGKDIGAVFQCFDRAHNSRSSLHLVMDVRHRAACLRRVRQRSH